MTIQIIFVDDDPMLLASTRRQLRRKFQNCDMRFFETAAAALESMETRPADIVLSDLRMPGMDGAELLSIVSQQFPDTVRLAWTGQSTADRLEKVLKIADHVFSKPCPTDTLVNILETVIESVSPQSPLRPIRLPAEFNEFVIQNPTGL